MITGILLLISAYVGYLFGVWRTTGRNDQELVAAQQSIKFWQDIAERQKSALRSEIVPPPPEFSLNEAKKKL